MIILFVFPCCSLLHKSSFKSEMFFWIIMLSFFTLIIFNKIGIIKNCTTKAHGFPRESNLRKILFLYCPKLRNPTVYCIMVCSMFDIQLCWLDVKFGNFTLASVQYQKLILKYLHIFKISLMKNNHNQYLARQLYYHKSCYSITNIIHF